MSNSYYKIFNA